MTTHASAQNAADPQISAEEAIEEARLLYGPPEPVEDCAGTDAGIISNEIVICRKKQDTAQFRIRSEEDAANDYAAETMNVGNPQAPDVGGPGIFRGPATVSGMCFIPPCPAPVMPDIDFAAIPEAPAGSDADRVGRGLPPRGIDDAVIEPTPVAAETSLNEGEIANRDGSLAQPPAPE